MRLMWCVLALCLAGVASDGGRSMGNRHRRGAGVFLSITGEKPRDKDNVNSGPLLPVQLPIKLGGQGGVTLPVLVLPVPVYTQAPDTCDANHNNEADDINLDPQRPLPAKQPPYVAVRQPFADATSTKNAPNANFGSQQLAQNVPNANIGFQQPAQNVPNANFGSQQPGQNVPNINFGVQQPAQNNPNVNLGVQQPSQNRPNFNLGVQQPSQNRPNFNLGVQQSGQNSPNFNVATQQSVNFNVQQPAQRVTNNVYVSGPNNAQALESTIPFSAGPINQFFQTSSQIVQSFLRQSPRAQQLPAVIPRPLPDRLPVGPEPPVNAPPIQAVPPPRPRFDRSLALRIDLNVPRADYTEAFQTEWHAGSRTSRMVVEDGGTTFYQAPLSDGRVQFLEIRVDRTGDREIKRCTLSPLMPPSAMDQSFPGLPDTDLFEFAGYTTAEGQSQVERWKRVVVGAPGEGGAARGEALTFRHELLVTRSNGASIPLSYTVVTDSSILGPACDSYTHRYRLLGTPNNAMFPDTKKECDVFDDLVEPAPEDKNAFAEITARFKPLLEFSLPMRDTRYDFSLEKFKVDFQRNYLDVAEEAVRKNILTQQSRFVAAGNRLASTFELAVNFLADRLDDEIELLLGVGQPDSDDGEPGLIAFPYSNNEVEDISNKLPDEFDWRKLGGVSPVRFQGTECASCWAFAVAGATEGALFKKTKRLVPLSAQCLVDCGGPYGCHGCNTIGTWPSHPYDYTQARGLPAWDEYTDYQAKELECRDDSVPPVTHISGHVNVTAYSESALKVAIKRHAPNVVIVDAKAKSFQLYKKGVLKDKRCGQNKPALNHAVLAVGYGTQGGSHFILKNSWTANWGEGGFIKVDPESCAVLGRPSYPLITERNIDREELKAAAATVASAGEED